jgi:hypothetical protein
LRKQRIEVTGVCCRNKHPAAFFQGSAADYPYQMLQANAYRAGPALATIPSGHALCDFGDIQNLWQLRSTK